MTERKTDYYDIFHCIADQCNLTCCQEWKIAVDDDTQEKWKAIKPPVEIMEKGIDHTDGYQTLSEYTTEQDETRVIKLDTEKKCPFLNKKKLCNLVIAYGDDVLSKTCAIFPRQVNIFKERETKEYSLVACCPAVVDLLKSREQFQITIAGDTQQTYTGYNLYEEVLSEIRNQMITFVQSKENTVLEGLMSGFFVLLSLLERQDKESEKKASAETIGRELRKEKAHLTAPEKREQILKTIRQMDFSRIDTFYERNELFLDLAENYRKQGIYSKWLEPIANLAEEMEDFKQEEILQWLEPFREVSKPYEQLMRNYVASELFANLLLPEFDLENVIIAFQWITMEYVTMMHAIFLQWLKNGRETLRYEDARDMIVIIARMMGYDEPDIREYMENSFEEIIWEWGYLALLCGEM